MLKQEYHLGKELRKIYPVVLETPVGAVLQLSGRRRYFKQSSHCVKSASFQSSSVNEEKTCERDHREASGLFEEATKPKTEN